MKASSKRKSALSLFSIKRPTFIEDSASSSQARKVEVSMETRPLSEQRVIAIIIRGLGVCKDSLA